MLAWVRETSTLRVDIVTVMEAEVLPDLDGMSHRKVTARGATFHVAESAAPHAGSPVFVLLHGWPQHWWCWRLVIPELIPLGRVVAMDLR